NPVDAAGLARPDEAPLRLRVEDPTADLADLLRLLQKRLALAQRFLGALQLLGSLPSRRDVVDDPDDADNRAARVAVRGISRRNPAGSAGRRHPVRRVARDHGFPVEGALEKLPDPLLADVREEFQRTLAENARARKTRQRFREAVPHPIAQF